MGVPTKDPHGLCVFRALRRDSTPAFGPNTVARHDSLVAFNKIYDSPLCVEDFSIKPIFTLSYVKKSVRRVSSI